MSDLEYKFAKEMKKIMQDFLASDAVENPSPMGELLDLRGYCKTIIEASDKLIAEYEAQNVAS